MVTLIPIGQLATPETITAAVDSTTADAAAAETARAAADTARAASVTAKNQAQAIKDSIPTTNDPIVADLIGTPSSATATALSATISTVAGRWVSEDGTDGLPAPTGVGAEFVRNVTGLDDIRFDGVSL